MKLGLILMMLGAGASVEAPAKPVAPVPVTAELVDLLDFDQGAVMLSASTAYSEGVSRWAAFYLADGSTQEGWCSGSEGPTGGEFVWELDRDSEPRTLRIVNAGVQESSYPGISARSVELWGAGASGAFEKLGAFEAPKGGTKEFPVVAKKPIRRVKVVVRTNWGNADYTELMELDLLGRKIGPAPVADVSGEYHSTSWNGLRMKQTGTHVDGCYDYAGGVFSGELEGRVAKVLWREFSDEGKQINSGAATFVVASDKSSVRGIYFNEEGSLRGEWNLGKPENPDMRPKCIPPGSSLAEQLARDGKVVLYGIRFDVNSDVPRADSEPTLREILKLLEQAKELRLRVEGHTDSTNTDAYNQALSERRARAVVKWLSERGVAETRLAAEGIGRARPVASNDTAQGRALNRRVELAPLSD